MKHIIAKFFAFFVLLHIGQSQTYPTNQQRTVTVRDQCRSTRANLFQSTDRDRYSYYGDLTGKQLRTNGDSAVRLALQGDWRGAYNDLKNQSRIWTYFVFFAAGGAILLVSLPFLLCCICCPRKCPPCNSCRDPQGQPPSSSSLFCPTLFLIILSIITIATMVVALVVGRALQNSVDEIQCGVGIVFDDALNGNASLEGEYYFIGLTSLQNQLQIVNSNLTNIATTIEPISSSGTQVAAINTKLTNAKTTIANIPNGAGGDLTLNYDSPFNSATPTTTIPSLFPGVLGNAATPGTLVGNATIGVVAVQQVLQGISQTADEFQSQIPQFQTQITSSIQQLQSKSSEISSKDKQINDQIENAQDDELKKAAIAYYVIAAAIIFFTVLLIITGICTCTGSFACRKIMYFICFFMTLLGILSFLLSILFSFTTMGGYFGCQYIKAGLQSPQNFRNNFDLIIQNPTLTSQLSVCVPTGSGNIIELVVGQDVFNLLESLQTLSTQLQAFNGNAILSEFQQSYINLAPTILNYQTAKILDFSSTSNLAIIQKVSDASQYTCSETGFSSDSWIPSLNQINQYVSCKITNGAQFTGTSCADFTTKATGCVGCVDTYAVFAGNTTSAQVLAALATRYTAANCLTFNTDLANVWNNFYRIKKDNIGPVHTRAVSATTDLNGIYSDMQNNVIPVFNTAYANLKSTYSSIFDPKYGMLAGLNCKILGEDLVYASDQLCSKSFVHSYILRVMFIISSFCIMLMLCFVTCLGKSNYNLQEIRAYPAQNEAKTEQKFTAGYFGTPQTNARSFQVHL